ncbi:MAG TPA: 4-aminobutyrate--2-oxoglutarate transaminase [Micromonosporaceae bacterium]|nr:4-aminobutyrate--2-oxoglutarate transaminase [Micromonosporaceae bacterium]
MTTSPPPPAPTGAGAARLRTEIPGPRSRELQDRRKSAVAGGVGSTLPAFITDASDGLLVDVDGNRLIDLGAGIAVTNAGNAPAAVVEAVRAQVDRFTHTCFMVTPYEGYVEVCERLNELTPGGFDKRSALFNSGAEAVENAVKIARYHTRRPAVAVFDHAYHGRTNLTMALTAKNLPYKSGFGPFAPEVYRVPGSYPYRDGGLSGAQAAAKAISQLEKMIGANNLAAVLLEPIQGEGGVVAPAEGFLPELTAWCRDKGVLLIADEIQTGFCRTGDWFACEHEGVEPDLVTTAKGIASGFPLAGVTGRAEVMDAVHVGGLGGTYGGNPVACAAALATIDTMRAADLPAAARRIAETVVPSLQELAARTGVIGDIRGRGAMLGIEFVRPGTTEPDAELTRTVAKACHAAGVLVLTAGTYDNVIRLLPPLTIPADLLTEGLEVLSDVVAAHA